jgi:integrase
MNLHQELDRYLSIRRSLGYDLCTAARVLRRFVSFAEADAAEYVSVDLFARWQRSFGKASRQTWALRFCMVRLFANWLHGLDPKHQAMPRGLVPHRNCRKPPHIYDGREVAAIVATAAKLPSTYGLRGLTYSTLFGLIAVSGLRISEALALDTGDVDLPGGILRIRRAKLNKARLVPIHSSVAARLRHYMAERDRLLGYRPLSLFVSDGGVRLSDCTARYNFAHVCQLLGLRSPQRFCRHGRGPRVHDLRHSFAARTMIGCYRAGNDAGGEMIKLTTYLGHTRPQDTYWYIEAVPELLELASQRVAGRASEEVFR